MIGLVTFSLSAFSSATVSECCRVDEVDRGEAVAPARRGVMEGRREGGDWVDRRRETVGDAALVGDFGVVDELAVVVARRVSGVEGPVVVVEGTVFRTVLALRETDGVVVEAVRAAELVVLGAGCRVDEGVARGAVAVLDAVEAVEVVDRAEAAVGRVAVEGVRPTVGVVRATGVLVGRLAGVAGVGAADTPAAAKDDTRALRTGGVVPVLSVILSSQSAFAHATHSSHSLGLLQSVNEQKEMKKKRRRKKKVPE